MAIQAVVARPVYQQPINALHHGKKNLHNKANVIAEALAQKAKLMPVERADQEEVEAFTIDAVTMEPLLDPVIDKCGHTLNRTTFLDMERVVEDGIENPNLVICPFSRQQVRLDKLIRNLYATHASAYLVKSSTSFVSYNRVLEIVQQVKDEGEKMHKDNQKIIDELRVQNADAQKRNVLLQKRNDVLEQEAASSKRQIQNFLDMSFCDRLTVFLNPNQLSSIQKRDKVQV